MSETMTADQLLSIAIDMEKTGQVFYESLALGCGQREVSAACVRLCKTESQHAATFTEIRRHLPAATRGAPLPPDVIERFRAVRKTSVVPDPSEVRRVALHGGLKDLLAMAIRMEQDSVRFYEVVLREMHPAHVAIIDQIVREEKRHVNELWSWLAKGLPTSGGFAG